MDKATTQFWFKSPLFKIEPGEDEETSPLCYGKQLAEWLRKKFSGTEDDLEEIIPEDWGWCVLLQRKPYLLWVGCGNVGKGVLYDSIPAEDKERFISDTENTVWTCFIGTDTPVFTLHFWKRVFRKTTEEEQQIKNLSVQLEKILTDEPEITLVEEPLI